MEDLKPHRHAGRSRLVLGLFLLALGGLMLAVNLGYGMPIGWWQYFPVPLIALGLWGLVLPSRHLDRSGGVWLLATGLYCLIGVFDCSDLGWGGGLADLRDRGGPELILVRDSPAASAAAARRAPRAGERVMDFDHDPRSDRGRDRPAAIRDPATITTRLFSARLVVGIVIILLGAILLADNLGWFEARYVLRSLWPLALVAVGVAMVRSPEHRRSRSWGWVLITVGIWIFLDKIGWVHVSLWQLLLPGLLLFVGGTLVLARASAARRSRQAAISERPTGSRRVRALVRADVAAASCGRCRGRSAAPISAR